MYLIFPDKNSLKLVLHLGCIDTPGWKNPRFGCNHYESKGWCQGGSVVFEWTIGKKFNNPEDNCCVCGKGKYGKYYNKT